MIVASAEPTAKAGWEVKTLGEVCIVDWGNTELTKKSYIEEGEFLAVSAAGCDGRINHAEHKKFTPVLSAIGAQCGRMFFPEEDFTAIKNTITLTPIQTETYHKFLFHLLTAVELPKRGAAQPFISKGDIQSFPIPVPPLAEQERIVGILDKAFEGIAAATAQAEKNLHNARELFQSVLQSTFSQKGDDWVENTLGEVCETFQYGTSSKSLQEGDVPVLRMGNLQEGYIKWNELKYTSNSEEISKYLLSENDVLFNRTNSSELVGKSSIYDGSRPAIHAGYLIRVQTKPETLDPKFLNYFLNCPSTRDHGFSVMSKSVNQANINATKLKAYRLNKPPLPTQQAIVEKLDALSEETKRLEAIYERKQAALSELKQSLLQKAFAGEL